MVSKYLLLNFKLVNSAISLDIKIDRVMGIEIRKRYLQDIYPRILTVVSLKPSDIRKIASAKTKATLSIVEQRFNSDTDLDNPAAIPVSAAPVINATFDVVITSNVDSLHLKEDPTTFPTDGEENVLGLDTDFVSIELGLINLDAINKIKSSMEGIYKSAPVSSMLLDCIQGRGLGGYVSPPTSNRTYGEAHIPFGNLKENIRFLNNVYGLYDSEPMIFHDITEMYVLNFQNPNIVMKRPKDPDVILYSPKSNSADKAMSGQYFDPKRKVDVLYIQNNPELYKETDVHGYLRGSAVALGTKGPSGMVSVFGDAALAHGTYSDNPIYAQWYKNMIKINSTELTVIADHCSYNIFSPLRTYIRDIDINEQRYDNSKKLVVKNVIYAFRPMDGTGFLMKATAQLCEK